MTGLATPCSKHSVAKPRPSIRKVAISLCVHRHFDVDEWTSERTFAVEAALSEQRTSGSFT
jgi:hypothetical protein